MQPLTLDLLAPLPERPTVPVAAEVRAGVVAGVLCLLAGAPLGVLWSVLVPRLAVVRVGDPSYLLTATEEDRAGFGGDLVMVAILAAAGLLVGLLAAWLGRRRLLGTVVGVLVGATLGGVLAMALGHDLVRATHHAVDAHAADGTVFQVKPYVRDHVLFLVFPLTALVVLLASYAPALLAGRPDPEPRGAGHS